MAHSFSRARQTLYLSAAAVGQLQKQSTTRQILAVGRQRRFASSQSIGTESLSVARLKVIFQATAVSGALLCIYLYESDTRAATQRFLVPRFLRLLYPDAEDAHHAGTTALQTLYRLNLHPRERFSSTRPAEALTTAVFDDDTKLANPVGISAGLDKDAVIPDALFALGAAVVEVGGITPRPQAGNPRPRVWRVPSLDGMVNRYGLNSQGADAVAATLHHRVQAFARRAGLTVSDVINGQAGVPPGALAPGKLLAVQIAKGKETADKDAVDDYTRCVRILGQYADVLVVNVSSPNTPGLRDLQATGPLTEILSSVVEEAKKVRRKTRPRVMVKVSPDEDDDGQVEGICQAIWASGVDGVIVGNTTKRRTGLVPDGVKLTAKEQSVLTETGGYSGPAMFERTASLVGKYRKMLDATALRQEEAGDKEVSDSKERAQKVIFATGGISNGEQALKILNAGASVAMVYTAMVYGGAGTITRIKGEILDGVAQSKRIQA